ncbi:MAG: hypothetical protein HOV80_20345 [Polyangiaceae bacterium]|nr:hypothetical protein [Polyangiaceae bacterium]
MIRRARFAASAVARALAAGGLVAGGLLAASASGCFTGSDGLFPPTESLYFPTVIAVSPGRTSLYVANSDFDLQYNGGTVQVMSIVDSDGLPGSRTLAEAVAVWVQASEVDPQVTTQQVCASIGSVPNMDVTMFPGLCAPIFYQPLVRDFATVGAFTSGMTLLPRQDSAGMRLFVTVRGDPSVTFFDVADDRDPNAIVSPCGQPFCLDCDATGDERRCSVGHRIGESSVTNVRGLSMPTEPTGIAANPQVTGDSIVVAHQTEAAASLLVNRWDAGSTVPWPTLEFTLRDLPEGPLQVVAIPPPLLVKAAQATITYRPGFVVGHESAPTLSVLRYEDDAAGSPPRPFLINADETAVTVQGEGIDTRGMAIDSTERDACEALQDPTDVDGLAQCAENFPLRFYAATRSPAALMVGTVEVVVSRTDDIVTSVTEFVSLDELVALPLGPSGVYIGNIINKKGELEKRVFIVSFDSRAVTPYNPVLHEVEGVIKTGRGPFGLAFDTGVDSTGALRSHMYVSHFTDSYLGVVDLDRRRSTYGSILISLGPPVPPREEQ